MDASPLSGTIPDADKTAYQRALRATVTTNRGPLTVYVVHLGSVRVLPGTASRPSSRDRGAGRSPRPSPPTGANGWSCSAT